MEKLPISVIVVVRNAEKTIEDCLSAVKRNQPAEIIVVDGNSSDRTVEIAQKYTQNIYCDGGRGKSYARQLGAEMATQEYIAYVDSDIVLATNEALATMLAELRALNYVHVAAQLVPRMKHSSYWERAQYEHSLLHQASFRSEGCVGLAAGLFKRETILKYGFDISYGGHMDDIALEFRLRRDGHRLGISSAQCYHQVRADMKSIVKYRLFLGKVALCYIKKYGIWHAKFWPPLGMLYWLSFCLIKGKLKLIPYEIIDGVTRTVGMVKALSRATRALER